MLIPCHTELVGWLVVVHVGNVTAPGVAIYW